MMQPFSFDEATLLQSFLDDFMGKVAGGPLTEIYYNFHTIRGQYSDNPIVLSVGSTSLIVFYMLKSDAVFYIVDTEQVQQDQTLNFLFRDNPVSSKLRFFTQPIQGFPLLGHHLKNITIARFSDGFEIDPTTDERRPDGGDYFSSIIFEFDNGETLRICGADAGDDSYMIVSY